MKSPATDNETKWGRLPKQGQTLRGLSRSLIYQLCVAGLVKSVVIQGPRPKGPASTRYARKTPRGARLIDLESLDAYIESIANQQPEEK